MVDALLPCPFCGSIDLFVDTVDGSLPPQTGQTVTCEDCTAKASYGDWNTRQPTQSDTEIIAENKRLREALGWFLNDSRFVVQVGGNPYVVPHMIEAARAALGESK